MIMKVALLVMFARTSLTHWGSGGLVDSKLD